VIYYNWFKKKSSNRFPKKF